MDEALSLTKFIRSPFSAIYWVKVISFMFGMAFILMIGWAFYKAYFKKVEPTTTQNNTAEEIVYHSPTPHATFGCASVKVIEYYRSKK